MKVTSPGWARALGLLMIVLAFTAAFLTWWWFVSHERPILKIRFHVFAYDILDGAIHQGHPERLEGALKGPLVEAAMAVVRHFGFSYPALLGFQVPFMFLLIFSVGLIAWRFQGPGAGALAAWLCALTPSATGTALEFNELLGIASITMFSVALAAWSFRPRFHWLAVVSPLPILGAFKISQVFSNGFLPLVYTLIAISTMLLVQWFLSDEPEAGQTAVKVLYRWVAGLVLFCCIALVLDRAGFFFVHFTTGIDYLFGQYSDAVPEKTGIIWHSLTAIPAAWAIYQVGPVLAAYTVGVVVVLLIKKRAADILPFVLMLVVPMILLSLVTKRREHYLLAAVPATALIIGIGIAQIKSRIAFLGAALICIMLVVSLNMHNLAVIYQDIPPKDTVNKLLAAIYRHKIDFNYYEASMESYVYSPYAPFAEIEKTAFYLRGHCSDRGKRIYTPDPYGGEHAATDFIIRFHNPETVYEKLPESGGNPPGFCVLIRAKPDKAPGVLLKYFHDSGINAPASASWIKIDGDYSIFGFDIPPTSVD